MNTLLDYLVVLALAALLLGPALYGALRERRLERQIRAAGQPARSGRRGRARTGSRSSSPQALRPRPGTW
ncbi:hypothetical protein [Streptomyces sp. NPDC058401]|uniref:hypothetical protein n=1 Tax=Streptomyces sp. NPDC058401 TaxID=3346480 RepID=UPI003669ECA9